MYRIRRGTWLERCRQVRLFSALLPHTLPRLRIQRGGASLLFSFTSVMDGGMGWMIGERGEEAPLYSGGGGLGATLRGSLHGNLISPG